MKTIKTICKKYTLLLIHLLIIVGFTGCSLTPPPAHKYPIELDYSYTLSDRNYTFAIYNNKHRLMTHPIRDLKGQMEKREKDNCSTKSISDIYIVSHGWNYTATEAVANYHKYIELADNFVSEADKKNRNLANPGTCPNSTDFQPYFMFVTWTSTANPLSELSSGILPLAVDNIVHPIAWTVDTIAFHIPSAWKQSLNAASNALGNVFPNHYLFKNWKSEDFGTEPYLSYLIDEDYSLGRELPLSALIYELIKCKYEDTNISEESAKCLLGEKSLEDVKIHLVGHSYGGKLVALAGMESLRRWMLVDRLKINNLNDESTEIEEEQHEDKLRLLGHHFESKLEDFGGRMFLCIYIAGCADEDMAKDTISKEISKLEANRLPITSLLLFNPAFHPGELWYSPRDLFEFEKAPVSVMRLIARKGIVYSKYDLPNGSLFNIRELLLNTQVTQSFQQQVQTDFNFNPFRLAVDIPVGLASSVAYGSLLYVGTTLYNLPLDFIHHVQKNDTCGLSEDVHPIGLPFYWLANTVDFFFPFLCGLHWDPDKLNIGPFRDEERQGIFRLSRPALGKTGINQLVTGRKSSINLWGLTTFQIDEKSEGHNNDKETIQRGLQNFSSDQFCRFSHPSTPIGTLSLPNNLNEPSQISESIYSFDASKVYNSFPSSHSDIGQTEKISCDTNLFEPEEKRKYSFFFTYKFTKSNFWEDPALALSQTE